MRAGVAVAVAVAVRAAVVAVAVRREALPEGELTGLRHRGVLRSVTIDTDVRLWRRVHMDLVRYAGCTCRPSC
ncbi:putative leader peptide [Streptomyces sp. NPDC059524]|uniref:putative leader peptide n=1 Tax=Streptomyces sp. NPDC059524 TaxID=3346856 RepID=UPI0036BD2C1B